MPVKNAVAKTWNLPAAWNGRRYSDPAQVPAQGGLVFSDNFAANNLSHTQNGVSWTSTAGNVSAASGALVMQWASGAAMAEQRFSMGATQRPELWVKYDMTVAPGYSHPSGNWKSFVTLWTNSDGSPSYYNDGYDDPNGLLIGLEMWPNGAGGSMLSQRVYGSGYDYNVHTINGTEQQWPNGIVPADVGVTRQIVMQIKAATAPAADYQWSTPSDGIWRVWKDGALIMNKTNCNIYKPGWAGLNRGYLFGWRNGSSPPAIGITIDNFVLSTTNLWGVS